MANDERNDFSHQDRTYTGNAVNARTGDMGRKLDRRADQLDQQYAEHEDREKPER